MKLMLPGLYEYQVAAKMVDIHDWGGSEAEGYAPIVGAGPNSTALHYDNVAVLDSARELVVVQRGGVRTSANDRSIALGFRAAHAMDLDHLCRSLIFV